MQAVLKPTNADAAVQAAVFHLYQADVGVQATAEKSRISPTKTSTAVQPVATQPPIRAHHRGYQVQDEVCQDRTFDQLVKQSKLREKDLARLESNLGFGFKPNYNIKPF